jgi:D-aminopeptidase
MLALSTANPGTAGAAGPAPIAILPNGLITPLFDATIQAVEEAIVNALVAAETMTGLGGRTVEALPIDRLGEIMMRHGRPLVV